MLKRDIIATTQIDLSKNKYVYIIYCLLSFFKVYSRQLADIAIHWAGLRSQNETLLIFHVFQHSTQNLATLLSGTVVL